jgi:hypothetical protein
VNIYIDCICITSWPFHRSTWPSLCMYWGGSKQGPKCLLIIWIIYNCNFVLLLSPDHRCELALICLCSFRLSINYIQNVYNEVTLIWIFEIFLRSIFSLSKTYLSTEIYLHLYYLKLLYYLLKTRDLNPASWIRIFSDWPE